MLRTSLSRLSVVMLLVTLLAGCAPATMPAVAPDTPASALKVVAVETFLADIAQNVAGDRLRVESLIPIGIDPHGFQPTPTDVKKVAASQVLIVNGAGLEEFLGGMLKNAGGKRNVIEAAAGLQMREPQQHEGDPHFWLDPVLVARYAENIRDGLSQADPEGTKVYAANADVYIAKLKDLDKWITEQVRQVPEKSRQLVTNHESLGYFADQYGFTVIGTIIPNATTGASPSAKELAALTDHVKQTGVKAIFLETGANPQLAKQLAQETGIKVVTELYTHSVTAAGGPAPTYLDMIRYNARAIVDALK